MRKVGRSLNRIMRRIQAAEARKKISSLVQRSQAGERIKVTRYNKTAAILISKRDLQRLEECERQAMAAKGNRARGGR